ncbi:MAG: hypothetical protein FJW68_08335 [Actinobacteria bacterium]|nr:hypothetical protein [Actinomycetota bacterium]
MRRQIDILVEVAQLLGADKDGIELSRIIKQVMKMDSENRFNSEEGIAATLNYHTINMRSRFQYPAEKDKSHLTSWKSEPYFYREDRGIYRLLSDEEKAIFRKAVDDELDIIYRDEFTVFQLKKALG